MLRAIHYGSPSINKIEITDGDGNPVGVYLKNTDTVQIAQGVTAEAILRAAYKEQIAAMPAPPKETNTK